MRLCDESLYSYLGRSDQQAVELADGGTASENTVKQAAPYWATKMVNDQKSADAIVAKRPS